MASDRVRFENASEKWEGLLNDGCLSLPSHEGGTAILCPLLPENLVLSEQDLDDRNSLAKEALDIADNIKNSGAEVDVGINAQFNDFADVLRNPFFSDIIVVGHGTLSCVGVKHPNEKHIADWEDLAMMTDHLKLGSFVQRICGRTPRTFNAPLGLMTVADHRDVFAAVGIFFRPKSLDDPINEMIQPVTDLPRMGYREIKTAFPMKLPIREITMSAMAMVPKRNKP